MGKGELFVKEVVARLTGNDNDAKAAKIGRKAISALTSQIATLSGKQVDAEIDVESKEEALKDAIYSTEVFDSNQRYCEGISRAQNNLDDAKEKLEDINNSLIYFKNLLESF